MCKTYKTRGELPISESLLSRMKQQQQLSNNHYSTVYFLIDPDLKKEMLDLASTTDIHITALLEDMLVPKELLEFPGFEFLNDTRVPGNGTGGTTARW